MISIIIPTLNEEEYLRKTIEHTLSCAEKKEDLEIIVIDAGSTDSTLESIEAMRVKTFSLPEFVFKKFLSMNFGAQQSSGEIIMFLDADTFLPEGFDQKIRKVLQNQKVYGGAFEFSFLKPDWKLSIITFINRIRYRFGRVYYGDQAVFLRRSALEEIGGVPENPLMETAYLCKRLRRVGKLSLIKSSIKTSPRRFNEHGFFKIAWFDLNMFIRFNLGFPVSPYAEKYWSKNLKT
ncbi:TIGR04283 family arsenosugar biosynthesis glycosyltransferase [Ekhidna sp.]|uniref:TIGR04283 family arsenosugar biosynthesis glycosyltransferase n=1 Tax=Ekhidna sp. TaxID=2608089 RepID=UPI0032F068DC